MLNFFRRFVPSLSQTFETNSRGNDLPKVTKSFFFLKLNFSSPFLVCLFFLQNDFYHFTNITRDKKASSRTCLFHHVDFMIECLFPVGDSQVHSMRRDVSSNPLVLCFKSCTCWFGIYFSSSRQHILCNSMAIYYRGIIEILYVPMMLLSLLKLIKEHA